MTVSSVADAMSRVRFVSESATQEPSAASEAPSPQAPSAASGAPPPREAALSPELRGALQDALRAARRPDTRRGFSLDLSKCSLDELAGLPAPARERFEHDIAPRVSHLKLPEGVERLPGWIGHCLRLKALSLPGYRGQPHDLSDLPLLERIHLESSDAIPAEQRDPIAWGDTTDIVTEPMHPTLPINTGGARAEYLQVVCAYQAGVRAMTLIGLPSDVHATVLRHLLTPKPQRMNARSVNDAESFRAAAPAFERSVAFALSTQNAAQSSAPLLAEHAWRMLSALLHAHRDRDALIGALRQRLRENGGAIDIDGVEFKALSREEQGRLVDAIVSTRDGLRSFKLALHEDSSETVDAIELTARNLSHAIKDAVRHLTVPAHSSIAKFASFGRLESLRFTFMTERGRGADSTCLRPFLDSAGLKRMHLCNLRVRPEDIGTIARFTGLEELQMQLDGEGRARECRSLQSLKSLQRLSLDYSHLHLVPLRELLVDKPALKHLSMDSMQISRFGGHASSLEALIVVPQLESLNLNHWPLNFNRAGYSTNVMSHLPELSNLRALHIRGSSLHKDSVPLLATRCPNLRMLEMGEWGEKGAPTYALDDDDYAGLARFEHLHSLKLFGTSLGPNGFKALAEARPALRSVQIYGDASLDAAAFEHVGALEHIEELTFYQCANVDAACFERMTALPRLKNLSVFTTAAIASTFGATRARLEERGVEVYVDSH